MSALFAEFAVSGDWRLFLFLIPLALLLWWLAKQFDVTRIQSYGAARGWRFEKIEYQPFPPNSSSDSEERFYAVRYVDAEDIGHQARCKTSRSTGVYSTDVRSLDRAVSPATTALPSLDCPRCGHTVGAAEAACPNCLKPRASLE